MANKLPFLIEYLISLYHLCSLACCDYNDQFPQPCFFLLLLETAVIVFLHPLGFGAGNISNLEHVNFSLCMKLALDFNGSGNACLLHHLRALNWLFFWPNLSKITNIVFFLTWNFFISFNLFTFGSLGSIGTLYHFKVVSFLIDPQPGKQHLHHVLADFFQIGGYHYHFSTF